MMVLHKFKLEIRQEVLDRFLTHIARSGLITIVLVQGVLNNIVLGLENPLSKQSTPNSDKASENGVVAQITPIIGVIDTRM